MKSGPMSPCLSAASVACKLTRCKGRLTRSFPVIADEEDSLGLCLMDMHEIDLANEHFHKSEQNRRA